MKKLKFIFISTLFLTTFASCTDLEIEENPEQTTIENTQSTGDESTSTDDGSKD